MENKRDTRKIENSETHLLLFFVSSKNRFKNLVKLVDSIYESGKEKNLNSIITFLVDDGSDTSYDFSYFKKYPNVYTNRNDFSLHKYKSFLKYLNLFPKVKMISWIDDKDYFLEGWYEIWVKAYQEINKQEKILMVSNFYSETNQIIGKSIEKYDTFEEFYLKKNNFGDKLWFVSWDLLNLVEDINSYDFKYESIYNFELFTTKLYDIKIDFVKDLIVYHPYLEGGITKNRNLEMKRKSANFVQYITVCKIKKNIGILNKIYRLYDLWNVRKFVSNKPKIGFKNWFIYYAFFIFFPFFKKYFEYRLKKI